MVTPTIDIRRGDSRARTRTAWLDSRHSFSFGSHHDPENTHHGLLLVSNDDIVQPGTGFMTHPHQDMEIITWVLEGELTFMIGDDVSVGGPGTCAFFPRNVQHAWKNSGSQTGRVVFLYTPASAGGYVEELMHRAGAPMNDDERRELRERYRWEIVGPNPL